VNFGAMVITILNSLGECEKATIAAAVFNTSCRKFKGGNFFEKQCRWPNVIGTESLTPRFPKFHMILITQLV